MTKSELSNFVWALILICAVTVMIAYFCSLNSRPHEFDGAWSIVKQTGQDNYGYVTELGWDRVNAGFSNKAEAQLEMKIARENYRHPLKPVKPKSVWEVQ